ncbi:MAG: hypothetical protein U9O64_10810 [Campylobacterota bacterium]|nr:hypothetical protein [Campylobacterota bacterium]
MDIEFKGLDETLKISDHTVREVTEPFGSADVKPKTQTHFQALISGSSISKNSIINCLFKYYGKDNQFLGLDKQDIWVQEKQPIALSVNITIPDGTVKSEIQFEVRKDFGIYLGWLWGIGIFFIIFLGINSLLNLFN